MYYITLSRIHQANHSRYLCKLIIHCTDTYQLSKNVIATRSSFEKRIFFKPTLPSTPPSKNIKIDRDRAREQVPNSDCIYFFFRTTNHVRRQANARMTTNLWGCDGRTTVLEVESLTETYITEAHHIDRRRSSPQPFGSVGAREPQNISGPCSCDYRFGIV